jgi:hypothetical protein
MRVATMAMREREKDGRNEGKCKRAPSSPPRWEVFEGWDMSPIAAAGVDGGGKSMCDEEVKEKEGGERGGQDGKEIQMQKLGQRKMN